MGGAPARSGPVPLRLDGLIESVVAGGLEGLPIAEQVEAFCRRLDAAGFPARRFNLSIGTLHPQHGARSYIWRPQGMTVEEFARTPSGQESEAYLQSPIHRLRTTRASSLRRRLDASAAAEFPVLAELRSAGMTDYAAWLIRYSPDAATAPSAGIANDPLRQGAFFSCTTDRASGFEDAELEQVASTLPYLALGARSRSTYDIAQQLLHAYVGVDAGERVLTGELDRHELQSIPAVIWLCDLRGFSSVANRVGADELIEILNAYLELMSRPVLDQGGQILKFLGDGFLATFDLRNKDTGAVCIDAVQAAQRLVDAFPRFNAKRRADGRRTLDFGVALHLGEVLYGNVGTSERLDFTVVGSAVNEASRIEGMCRPLHRSVLMSSRFHAAAAACHGRMISVGVHALRSIREPQELFTLADAAR
jgi:adenylate cyclase